MADWPSAEQSAAALLAAITAQIEQAGSEEERSRWQRIYDAIVDVGQRVFVEVALRAITREM